MNGLKDDQVESQMLPYKKKIGGTEFKSEDFKVFNVILVKPCSLGTERREGNLELATLLAPANIRPLYHWCEWGSV